MWEALAPILRWPLYSAARFFTVVVAVLVAVALAGSLNSQDAPASAPASPAPAATATTTGAAASPTPSAPAPSDDLSGDLAATELGTAAADAAAGFVAAWARPDLDEKSWSAVVRPLVTKDLWTTGLSLTDPQDTPAVTVAGEPRQVTQSATKAVYDVPTTGAWVRVRLTRTDGNWLVSAVEPTG